MCFDPAATPPPLPSDVTSGQVSGEVSGEQLVLDSGDAPFRAHLALGPASARTAVVVLPDVRGLFGYYEHLAESFAAAGHHAIALDYFGRTAGLSERPGDFDFMPHIMETTPEQVRADVRACIAALRERAEVDHVVTVGFCFGGTQSYLATTDPSLGLSGAVAFYGGLDATRLGVFPSPAAEAPSMHGPILALFGGADPSIPEELRDEFDRALTDAGVEHELVVYPGAPHSFFDRSHGEHGAECEDAWRRVLGFLAALREEPTATPG
jgi:carboxymethylenebutenolidase